MQDKAAAFFVSRVKDDVATQLAGHTTGYRQSETYTFFIYVRLIEVFKDLLLVTFFDAATGIGDAETDDVLVEFVLIAAQGDSAILWGELDGIIHQVTENLLHLLAVGHNLTTVFEQQLQA